MSFAALKGVADFGGAIPIGRYGIGPLVNFDLNAKHRGRSGRHERIDSGQPGNLARLFSARPAIHSLAPRRPNETVKASIPRYSSSAKLAGVASVARAFSTPGWLARNVPSGPDFGELGGLAAAHRRAHFSA